MIKEIRERRKAMNPEHEMLKGNTPTLVLAVLQTGPRHGYAVAREIERRTENSLRCKEGTLYPTLHTLQKEGLIIGEWQKEAGGRDRKIYSITPAGTAALEQGRRTWNLFATAVGRILGEHDDERSSGSTNELAPNASL